MKTTIVLGDEKFFSEQGLMQQNRKFVFFQSAEKAYLFHLENPEADSYLLDVKEFNEKDLRKIIKHIHLLNEIITVFLLTSLEIQIDADQTNNNIKICGTVEEIMEGLHSIPENHRKYNRARWPVSAVFHDVQHPEKHFKGMVTSISSGGCLITSKDHVESGIPVIISISFKNFNFLTEGEVVRQESRGFAVQFINISSQTKNIIQEIINEKILVELNDI